MTQSKGFALGVMLLGSLILMSGMLFLGVRLFAPEEAAKILPRTPSPIPPTDAYLLETPLAPPPINRAEMPIMPVMAVQQSHESVEDALSPTASRTIEPPTQTSTPFVTASPQATVFQTRTTEQAQSPSITPMPSDSPSPIPFITPTPTQTLVPYPPSRLIIPSIDLNAPIEPVWLGRTMLDGNLVSQWQVPEWRAAGWHETSAQIGQIGNTVLNGHHNLHGHVFGDLIDVKIGDRIRLEAQNGSGFNYTVVQSMLLEEENRSVEERLENARWLLPSHDERITLVTCWPPDGFSHRLVVIALPDYRVR